MWILPLPLPCQLYAVWNPPCTSMILTSISISDMFVYYIYICCHLFQLCIRYLRYIPYIRFCLHIFFTKFISFDQVIVFKRRKKDEKYNIQIKHRLVGSHYGRHQAKVFLNLKKTTFIVKKCKLIRFVRCNHGNHSKYTITTLFYKFQVHYSLITKRRLETT